VRPYTTSQAAQQYRGRWRVSLRDHGAQGGFRLGQAQPEAKRYIDETSSPVKPRNYHNAVVLAVPSRDGIEAARSRIRDYLGWEEVRSQLKEQLKGQELDPLREQTLLANISRARAKIADQIQQAYCIVVTVSDQNEIQAFKIAVDGGPLFTRIKEDKDKRARIRDSPVSADALLPDGPYDLWREGEKSRRLKHLVGAFALLPHLPKMLNCSAILETLVLGCKEGQFVLRVIRPDRSVRTFWRQEPDEQAIKDPTFEVVLPEAAEVVELSSDVLLPGRLPDYGRRKAFRSVTLPFTARMHSLAKQTKTLARCFRAVARGCAFDLSG
jgi:hypothetical protein